MKRITFKKLSTNELITFEPIAHGYKELGVCRATYEKWVFNGITPKKLNDYIIVKIEDAGREYKGKKYYLKNKSK